MTGLNAAFAHFGVKLKNPRWSWSARSDDGKRVVMTLWKDRLDYSNSPAIYRAKIGTDNAGNWLKRHGNQERLENLIWASDHCDGVFDVIIIEAVDTNSAPREIASSHAAPRMVGRITHLDRDTGEFDAEILDRNSIG